MVDDPTPTLGGVFPLTVPDDAGAPDADAPDAAPEEAPTGDIAGEVAGEPAPSSVADDFLDAFEDAIETVSEAAWSALRWHNAGRPDPWHGTQATLLAAANNLADQAIAGPSRACRSFGTIFDGLLEPGEWVELEESGEEPAENIDASE